MDDGMRIPLRFTTLFGVETPPPVAYILRFFSPLFRLKKCSLPFPPRSGCAERMPRIPAVWVAVQSRVRSFQAEHDTKHHCVFYRGIPDALWAYMFEVWTFTERKFTFILPSITFTHCPLFLKPFTMVDVISVLNKKLWGKINTVINYRTIGCL